MLLVKRTNVIEMLNRVWKYNVSCCPAGPPDEKIASETCFPGPKQLLNHSKLHKKQRKSTEKSQNFLDLLSRFCDKRGGYS